MKRIVGRLALVVLGFAIAALGLELLAALLPAWRLSPDAALVRTVPDPLLGTRGNRALSGVYDEHGFRNARRPTHADVVAIGDSQTEGEGVAREEAWPQQLQALTGNEVYQLALGGYGPGQYGALMEEALSLSPRSIVVGWYAGNDFADAFNWVWTTKRDPTLSNGDAELAKKIQAAHRSSPLAQAWQDTQAAKRTTRRARLEFWWREKRLPELQLYRMFDRALAWLSTGPRADAWQEQLALTAQTSPRLLWPLEAASMRTVFMPSARLAVIDDRDPRIAEGIRIGYAVMRRMHSACAGRCRLAVLLIPTKELVFADAIATASGAPTELHALIAAEQRVRQRIAAQLDADGIGSIDALPALRAEVADGRNPYASSSDGHPNAIGHRAIAAAVAAGLK